MELSALGVGRFLSDSHPGVSRDTEHASDWGQLCALKAAAKESTNGRREYEYATVLKAKADPPKNPRGTRIRGRRVNY